jgi:dephospho-CoA kinase
VDRLGLSPIRGVQAIGLTGGIGSGKSTVAQLLVGCGAYLVDTDTIARSLTQAGGGAMHAISEAFGPTARSTANTCARLPSPTPARSDASKPSCTR